MDMRKRKTSAKISVFRYKYLVPSVTLSYPYGPTARSRACAGTLCYAMLMRSEDVTSSSGYCCEDK